MTLVIKQSIVMLSISNAIVSFMLNIIHKPFMTNVVMMSVIMPSVVGPVAKTF